MWILSSFILGSSTHFMIFMVRDNFLDYITRSRLQKLNFYKFNLQKIIKRGLYHKISILAHNSWTCLWLGFHILLFYIHNDIIFSFGNFEIVIIIEPIFVKFLYFSFFKFFSITISKNLTSSDFLFSHAISFAIHTTSIILIKTQLDTIGSRLVPDKLFFGFGFSCDGPGRGGTCDISAWDSIYLGIFWFLNYFAWLDFLIQWKELKYFNNLEFKNLKSFSTAFDFYSLNIYGWFHDYLWFNSASILGGYNKSGISDLSVWAWTFLAAHLCWATGFMFLISWRGYWQELIQVVLFMHLRTPILFNIWSGKIFTPSALSIIQARLIGLVHFTIGFIVTYAAFLITNGI
jgi:photosystem I P700 chlorophyll a apoprotein A2